MGRMTEEEVALLDQKWTETTPKIGANGTGFIAKRKINTARMITIDSFSADYLFSKAIADHKTIAEIINNMIYEKLAVC